MAFGQYISHRILPKMTVDTFKYIESILQILDKTIPFRKDSNYLDALLNTVIKT